MANAMQRYLMELAEKRRRHEGVGGREIIMTHEEEADFQRKRQRVSITMSGLGLGDDAEDDDDEEEEGDGDGGGSKKELYVQVLPRSREQEQHVLGPAPLDQSDCFGCERLHADNGAEAAVPRQEVKALINMVQRTFGQVGITVLCKGMERFYNEMRERVNAQLGPGERPLPPWPASMILQHLRFHNQDPEIQRIVVLAEIQELRGEVFGACLEEGSQTGLRRGSNTQILNYDRLVKLQFFVMSKDPSKMPGFSAGGLLDPKTNSQGAIAHRTKNLVNFWRQRQRQGQ